MFRKKSRLFWFCALLLFFLVDVFLLWKVGIVSLGNLDSFRDVEFEQSSVETLEDSKEVETKREFGNKERIPILESKSDKGHSRKNEIENNHGLNCVCKDCLSSKKGRGSLYPINQ